MTIAAGYTKTCGSKSSGLKNVWLIDKADVTSMTLGTGLTSTYGIITLGSSKKWYEFEFAQDEAELRTAVEAQRR